MRFYEQYEHAGFACAPHNARQDERVAAFTRRFSSQSKGGVLNEWPEKIHEELTIGTVIRVANQTGKVPEALLLEIADGLWQLVKAK